MEEGKTPTPASSAGEAAAGLGVTPADRESLRTAWREFEEEEKTLYAIEICDPSIDDDAVVYSRIRLVEERLPLYPYGDNSVARVWELRWDYADTLVLSCRIVRHDWNGTGTEWLGEVTVATLLPETPWAFDYGELRSQIEENGVRETIEMILSYFLLLAEEVVGSERRG